MYQQQPFGQQMMYNQYAPQQIPQYTQPLPLERIRAMKKGGNTKFTVVLTPEEKDIGICTHKDPDKNNEFSLIENTDGTHSCYICGETFTIATYSREDVESAVSVINDILQNIKTFYLDMPATVASEYMTIIPLIKKIPHLYEYAINNFNKYDVGLHNPVGGQNAFGILNNIMAPGAMMPGMYNQPVYGGMQYPMGNPYGMNQPQMPNQYGMYQQQQQMGNPYGQPPVGGNPFAMGGGIPQQPQQPQQPQTANTGAAPTQQYTPQQGNVKVDKIFNTN